jgi:hypothetical protein
MTTNLLESPNPTTETAISPETPVATAPEVATTSDEPILAELVETTPIQDDGSAVGEPTPTAAETALTDAEPAAAGAATETPAETSAELSAPNPPTPQIAELREALLERIQSATSLPRGLQRHLASALQDVPVVDHDGRLLAPVDALLAAVEQWTPAAMRLDPRSLRRGEHPSGDVFFTGDPSHVSDEQAERIAREQLQRSGYLPRSGD